MNSYSNGIRKSDTGISKLAPSIGNRASTPLIQAKSTCACGGSCPKCNNKKNSSSGILQAKLQVGAPDDAYEQEADRVADEILATPSGNAISSKTPPLIQRLTSQTAGYRTTAPPSVEQVLSGSGRSLDTELQQDMSQRFGQDFSNVRIHTDAAAEQSAQEISAHAYTVGRNIVFGAGQFAPHSQQGKRLLAHELTHVVQQSKSSALSIQRYIAADVLTTQITPEQAEEMTTAELDQEIQRLRNHLATVNRTSDDYRGAVENLYVLERIVGARTPAIHRRRPLPRREPSTVAVATTAETPLSAVTELSNAEFMAVASRMTPDELSEEITRLRGLMNATSVEPFDDLVNQERLNFFERELSRRDVLILEHADSVHDARERFDLNLDSIFMSGFLAGSLHQIPPGEMRDFFDHDVREHPLEFLRGCDEGLGRGIVEGANNLAETFTSIAELLVHVVTAAIEHSDTISQLGGDAVQELGYQVLGEDLYTNVAADTSYLERRHSYERRAELIRNELQNFVQELARDPTIVIQWSGDLGRALGESFGRSFTEDFLRATPREQGVVVGRILGQILFEIILQMALAAATEGVGNAVRVGTGFLRGVEVSAELGNILREMAGASATVRRLLRIAETGEEVADTAVDAARLAEGATDLASARRAEGLGAITHVDEAHVPGVRLGEPPEPGVTTHAPEGFAPREPSIDTEMPHSDGTSTPDSVRTAEPSDSSAHTPEPESSAPAESSSGIEAPSSDPVAPTDTPPRTARERIQARRDAAASTRAELEETLRLSRADSLVLSRQLEEVDIRLRVARRSGSEGVELLGEQREQILVQMHELLDERLLIGEDWLEASRAGANATQEYFLSITNSARRYYPDGIESVFWSGSSVEHIVPRSRIFGMEGFESLTRDQQVSLFAWEPNLRLVPGEFNSARGATPYARLSRDIWGRFTTDESIISRLAGAETTLEEQILSMVRNPSTIPPLPE